MGAYRHTETIGRELRYVRVWFGWWSALAVVWLALVDTVRSDELIVGALAAAVAATVATAVLRRGYLRFSPRVAWLTETPALVRDVLVDCVLLGGALWRTAVRGEPVRGATIRVPFHYGDDSGRDGARRALVNFAVSLTPNSYVVDIDPEGDSVLVHRLVPVPLDRVLRREQRRADLTSAQREQGDHS